MPLLGTNLAKFKITSILLFIFWILMSDICNSCKYLLSLTFLALGRNKSLYNLFSSTLYTKSLNMRRLGYILEQKCKCMYVNVTDTILWQGHHDRVMQLNWLYLCGIYHIMPLKVWPNTDLGCNPQSICMPQLQPLCSAALVPNVLPRRDDGSGKPCAAIEAL